MYDRQLPLKGKEWMLENIRQGIKTPISSIYECCLSINCVTYHLYILVKSKKKIITLEAIATDHSGKNRLITEYMELRALTELLLEWFDVIKNGNGVTGAI